MTRMQWVGLCGLTWVVLALSGLPTSSAPLPERPKLLKTIWWHTDDVNTVAFTPDGKTLASGSDSWSIALWDATGTKKAAVLSGHRGRVGAVTSGPDALLLGHTGMVCAV